MADPQSEAIMSLKTFLGTALLILAASIAMALYWYTGIYRASEVRLAVSDGQVDLTELGDGWATLCILGPYASNSMAQDVTGIEIDIESRSKSVKYDAFAVLITIDANDRYRLFDVARHPADFTNLHATCWPHGTAFFIDPAASWHYVLPPRDG